MIKNLVFDFGNVLINLDFKKTKEGLSSLLNLDLENDYPANVLKNMLELEVGALKAESFLWRLQAMTKGKANPAKIEDAWNAMLLDIPDTRLENLLKYRENYKVFLLSNTNIIHIRHVIKYLKEDHGINNFEEKYFDKVYYSHELRMRKPDLDIFEFVLADANIIPGETLFIDDVIENTLAAAQLGIKVHHHDPSEDIFNILPELLHV